MDGFTLLASGYGSIEGPCVDDVGGVYFSDVWNGGVYRVTPDGGVEVAVPKRRGVGGICLHADGGIVVAGRTLARVVDGETEVIVEAEHLAPAANRFSGFNDFGADAAGRVFVGAGRRSADDELEDCELYLVTGEGEAQKVCGGLGLPNGVASSPDGRWLYHADTEARALLVLDLADPDPVPPVTRTLSTAAAPGGPDGLATDVEGGIWMALHGGGCIARFTPDGDLDRTVAVPAGDPLNLCFVGPELTELVVVTQDNAEQPELGGCVFRTSVGVQGREVPKARI
jgi:gluconolactonase